jgi:hypothetical protein
LLLEIRQRAEKAEKKLEEKEKELSNKESEWLAMFKDLYTLSKTGELS